MAVLVAAAKLAWGLDGRPPPRGVPSPPRWREWAWDCYARLERPMPSAMRFQQVLPAAVPTGGTYGG